MRGGRDRTGQRHGMVSLHENDISFFKLTERSIGNFDARDGRKASLDSIVGQGQWGKENGFVKNCCARLRSAVLTRSLVSWLIRFEAAAAHDSDATVRIAAAESMVPATTVVTASSREGLFAAPRRAHWAGASLGRGQHPQY